MDHFELVSEYKPTGDQPQAVETLANGILQGKRAQTLMGVTGSGKTFTMANIIERVQKPTLVISHNKTLAAQLHGEFKEFFPRTRWSILFPTTTPVSRLLKIDKNNHLFSTRTFAQHIFIY